MAEVAVEEGSLNVKGSLRARTFASAQGTQGLLKLAREALTAPHQQILMTLLVLKEYIWLQLCLGAGV